MRTVKLLALTLLGGLAIEAPAQRAPDRALDKLESARAANPSSVAALRALGVAYYNRDRFADARSVLDAARKLDANDGVSALYAGLASEKLNDFTGAKDAYNQYLQVGKTQSVRNDIRVRLVALARAELRAAAKAAIANEKTIAPDASNPRTVAVLPMSFSGTDQTIAPLSRGLSDLLINDLARSPELQLLERDRIQTMMDEVALSQSGQVDAATALRAGRLVRASRVVQGAITQTGTSTLTVNAAVMQVSTERQQGRDVQSSDALDRIFTLEKNLALGLFDQLGVRLSAAERDAIEQRPTRSLQAFLAYSNGLLAEDEGRFEDAVRYYDQALRLDPSFDSAKQKAQSARAALLGAQVTDARVVSNLRNSPEGAAVSAASRGVTNTTTDLGATLTTAVGDINPSAASTIHTPASTGRGGTPAQPPPTTRDPAAEKTGTDSPSPKSGTFTFVFRRP